MNPDIQTRHDLTEVLTLFYTAALADPLIGPFFTEVVPLDLTIHLPVLTDFWESVLWGKGSYRKDVMQLHRHIHGLKTIQKAHLDRWLTLFTQAVESRFAGETATRMVQRAVSIVTLIHIKLNHATLPPL